MYNILIRYILQYHEVSLSQQSLLWLMSHFAQGSRLPQCLLYIISHLGKYWNSRQMFCNKMGVFARCMKNNFLFVARLFALLVSGSCFELEFIFIQIKLKVTQINTNKQWLTSRGQCWNQVQPGIDERLTIHKHTHLLQVAPPLDRKHRNKRAYSK